MRWKLNSWHGTISAPWNKTRMKSLMKSKPFSPRLFAWYRKNKRDLPWRKTRDPYAVWISEIMLQQTTVSAVIPYFNDWLKQFPDVKALDRTPLQSILKAWQGLGYYQRAQNMKAAASIICKEYGGRFPDSYEKLIRLPGFGPYTTAAVLSIAFDRPYPVMDANVRRVLMRLKGIKKKASPSLDRDLSAYLKPLLPQKKMGDFNQSLMELGALVCRPKNPFCLLCPITDFCRAYEKGEQNIIPTPKTRRVEKIEAVLGIIKEDGRYLIQKRPSNGLLPDLWEFPGGKREPKETLEQTLIREIKEELGTEILEAHPLITVRHAYTRFLVTLHAFECKLRKKPNTRKKNMRWVTLKGLRRFPLPSGNAKIVRFLEERDKKL